MQLGAPALDPEVHRVARHEPSAARTCSSTSSWSRGSMLPRNTKGAFAELRRDLRAKVREHAEVRLERLGRVEVVAVAAAPAERLARRPARGRPSRRRASRSGSQLFHRIVVADDADQLHRRQVAGRRGEEVAGPAEHVVRLAERGFDGVERDGADDENGHVRGRSQESGIGLQVSRSQGVAVGACCSQPLNPLLPDS